MTGGIIISSCWGPRPETPTQIAARCRETLERLAAIAPAFHDWRCVVTHTSEQYQIVPLRHPHDGLVPLVEAGVSREDDGEPTPIGGYYLSAFTGSEGDSSSMSLKVHAGNCIAGNYYTNTVLIRTEPLSAENERLLTLPILKAAMLVIIDAWNVTWASIYPRDLTALWPKPGSGPHFRMAWVTYLSPRFAPLVTPPRSAIVERTPQSGLVMIATEARFDVTNPAHLAVARDIEAAIAPVNALPWPPDAAPA